MEVFIFIFYLILFWLISYIESKPETEELFHSEQKIRQLLSRIIIPDFSINISNNITIFFLNEFSLFDPGFVFVNNAEKTMYYSKVNLAFHFKYNITIPTYNNKTIKIISDNAYITFEHDLTEKIDLNLTKEYSLIFDENTITFNRSTFNLNGLENYSFIKNYFSEELIEKIKTHYLTSYINEMKKSFVHYPVCKSLSNLLLSREKMLQIRYYTINSPDYLEFDQIYYENDIKDNETFVLTNFTFKFYYHRYYDLQNKLEENPKNDAYNITYIYKKVLCKPEKIYFLDVGSHEILKDFVIEKFEGIYNEYARNNDKT